MENFIIEREVLIEAPVEVVWRTITEPDQITQWFADRVELEAKPGAAGTLVFESEEKGRITAELVVESAEAPTRFAFRWGHPEGERPVADNSVLVEFSLLPDGEDRTLLRVVESGLEKLAWASEEKDRYAEDHREGWTWFFGRLVDLFPNRADPQKG